VRSLVSSGKAIVISGKAIVILLYSMTHREEATIVVFASTTCQDRIMCAPPSCVLMGTVVVMGHR
jgi:predicted transcriptional regulator